MALQIVRAGVKRGSPGRPAKVAFYAFPVHLSYDDAGSGECVVLIHGHPFDRTLWEPQLAALRGSFRVLAPDLRGFGRSPVTPGRVLNLEAEAQFNEALITFLNRHAP